MQQFIVSKTDPSGVTVAAAAVMADHHVPSPTDVEWHHAVLRTSASSAVPTISTSSRLLSLITLVPN